MIVIVFLEYTQHILQWLISFLKIDWVLYLEMNPFETETPFCGQSVALRIENI